MQRSIGSAQKAKHYEEIIEKRFSNYRLMLYFALLSISVLFISLSLLYLFSRAGSVGKQAALQLHPLFFINSLLLGFSSIGLYFTDKYYQVDDFKRFKLFLAVSVSVSRLRARSPPMPNSSFATNQPRRWTFLFKLKS